MVLSKAGGGELQREAVLPSSLRSFYFQVGLVFLSCSCTWALQFSLVEEGKTFCPTHKYKLTGRVIVLFSFWMKNVSYSRAEKIRPVHQSTSWSWGSKNGSPWAKPEEKHLGKGRQFYLEFTWGVYSKICPRRRHKIIWLYWCWDLTPKIPNFPKFSVSPGETSSRNLCAQSCESMHHPRSQVSVG